METGEHRQSKCRKGSQVIGALITQLRAGRSVFKVAA